MSDGDRSGAVAGDRWFIDEATDHALASLHAALPAEEAPPRLWARIEEDLTGAANDVRGLVVNLFQAGEWTELAPGVRFKPLWNSRTRLVEFAPGAMAPPHTHADVEHCLVLSGDLVTNVGVFGPGDYHGLPPDTAHEGLTSRTGCVLLVQDEAA